MHVTVPEPVIMGFDDHNGNLYPFSLTQKLDRITTWVVSLIALAVGSFHLLNVAGLVVLSTQDIRIVHLMAMLAILFITKPTLNRLAGNGLDRWVGVALTLVSVAASIYMMIRWKAIAYSGGLETTELDAAALADELVRRARAFVASPDLADDLTLLVLGREDDR